MAIVFEYLDRSEIECRVGTCSEKGVSLLLFKDARCDMRILDKTVGPENWDCEYQKIGDGLFCTVGIRCLLESGETSWVYKQDVGTKSNMEPEKGEASDAFKRACFKWGIGRELYTAPFIWVPKESLQKHEYNQKRGKWTCNDKFHVDRIEINDWRITDLAIANQHNFLVYQMRSKAQKPSSGGKVTPNEEKQPQKASQSRFERIRKLKAEAMSLGVKEEGIESWFETTFRGKPKKELNDNEIKITEAYLTEIIRDAKELANG